jgi:hypothetical protein
MSQYEYYFKKGEYFDISVINEEDKRGLNKIAEESFPNFEGLENHLLYHNAHIGKKKDELPLNFAVHTLPFTLNKLPVYYEHPAGNLLIGDAEMVTIA